MARARDGRGRFLPRGRRRGRRSRRRNPARLAVHNRARRRSRRHYGRRSYRRRSRNPVGGFMGRFRLVPRQSDLTDAAVAIGAGIAVRVATNMVLRARDVGWMGYAGNLVASGVIAGLASSFLGSSRYTPALLGGLVFTGARVVRVEVAAREGAPAWLKAGLEDMGEITAGDDDDYDELGIYSTPALRSADDMGYTGKLAPVAGHRWPSKFG